jgi:hypothetical protein
MRIFDFKSPERRVPIPTQAGSNSVTADIFTLGKIEICNDVYYSNC